MLKKLVLLGTAGTLATGLVFGTGAVSYVKTGCGMVRDSVRDAVPVEVEIRRARDMIADLQPEIARNMQTIAQEKVQVERLTSEVSRLETQLADGKRDIQRLHGDLQSGDTRFVYAKREYSADQVREDLSARFKRFKTQEATAAKLRQMLTARERSLTAARDRMDAMLAAKRQLEVEVENLQARMAAVAVAQTTSEMNLDDSQLSQTRQLIDEIRTRIDVQEEMLAVGSQYDGTIQLDEESESGEDIMDEVAEYFSGPAREVELASTAP